MGSVAKRFGQWAARSVESEAAQIVRTNRANKIPGSLGQLLDTTLKDSHDLTVFGLGTLASLASRARFWRFTNALHAVYRTMEDELDQCCVPTTATEKNTRNDANTAVTTAATTTTLAPAVAVFWETHGPVLRRADRLAADLDTVWDCLSLEEQATLRDTTSTPATHAYVQAIRAAGQNDRLTGGARLLGHAYTRYLADLMGGQALPRPTEWALRMAHPEQQQPGAIQQYTFVYPDGAATRKEYVEQLYQDFNRAGHDLLLLHHHHQQQQQNSSTSNKDDNDKNLNRGCNGNDKNTTPQVLAEVVEEARLAFRHNVHLYSEEPIYLASVQGAYQIATGFVVTKRGRGTASSTTNKATPL